ncbi:TPA: hypothetical protein HA297_05335 [Candidatus Woesearchaeota archaeon]|nr:hypothetical protein [Candidatus Woesearchaeota archaeon]
MKNKFFLIFLTMVLFFIPVTYANVIFPYYMVVYGANIFLLIPIVLVEAGLAWYLTKKWYREHITMLRMSLYFLAANIFSALLGLLLVTGLYSIGQLPERVYSVLAYPETVLSTSALLIPTALLSALLEWPVLYFFLRKKIKNTKTVSWKLALFANGLSYLIILLLVIVTQTTMRSFFN